MTALYEHIMKESRDISNILGVEIPMLPLTLEQVANYAHATHCGNCNKPSAVGISKVHHHCHVTGEYLFATCVRCNLQLKQNRRRRHQIPAEKCKN